MRRLEDEPAAGPEGAVFSTVSGTARDVVQARDISGGVHFHAPATSAALRQLPATPAVFLGRAAEVAESLVLADRGVAGQGSAGRLVTLAVHGMAGVGKTALAVYLGRELAERFPDGQLFIDLRGFTLGTQPREPSDALADVLRAFGIPPQLIPQDTEARAALYRDRLAGKRALVVLDNARTEAQVRPLLPGEPGCLVIVTSRMRLNGLDDVHRLALGPLPSADAVALLRAMGGTAAVGVDEAALLRLAGLCGCLPLALRIAGALLRTGDHSPGQLAESLEDERTRLQLLDDDDAQRNLAALFALSYQALGPEPRLLLRRLGQHPGPEVDPYAAAALLDDSPGNARRLLQRLTDHSLLARTVPGRYRLHDLIRAYARALTAALDPEGERAAALSRLLHYYAHTAQCASELIARHPRIAPDSSAPAHTPAFANPEAARSWLRTELPGLDAAFTHAHTHALHDCAISLAAGLAEILQIDGPWTRALEIHQAVAEIADRSGALAAHAAALIDLGRARSLAGDYPGAAEALARALEIYRALGHRLGEANALADLGGVRYLTGDFPGAKDVHTRALEIYRALGNRLGEANALANLGSIRCLTGDFSAADDVLPQALEIYRALGHRLGEAYALTDLGQARSMTGNFAGADDAYARALELFRALGYRVGEATALNSLGQVRTSAGDYPGAGAAFTRALEIYRALGHRLGQANALTGLGRMRSLTGDSPGADNALTHALEIYRALGNRNNEAWALNHYAAALAASGERTRALAFYRQALAMNQELSKPDDEAISLEGIAEHYFAIGDPARGTAYVKQALEIYRRLGVRAEVERLQAGLSAVAGIGPQRKPTPETGA